MRKYIEPCDARRRLPESDLFGGRYVLPPDDRLLLRISVRLSPVQKKKFFNVCAGRNVTPSEAVRESVLAMIR